MAFTFSKWGLGKKRMLIKGTPNTIIRKDLEGWFSPFRENIIGQNHKFTSLAGKKQRLLYADWTASGRSYRLIEEYLINEVLPFIGNTHTESNHVGSFITEKYLEARARIKSHVNANDQDILVSYGSGMTDVLNKFQRILGLKQHNVQRDPSSRPVVFVTHMEHHSNHTSWLETDCEVVVVPPDQHGLVSVEEFEDQLLRFPNRPKIASITACSNVTGIKTPYHEIASLLHQYNGLCFVDFACSAPYVEINMHPKGDGYLDAIFFSPHKFLGGPGATGVLIYNSNLHESEIPDVSGGGTVDWTNPWGGRKYVECIEEREDGGTPAIMQTVRAAEAIRLKEEMGMGRMKDREGELLKQLWDGLGDISSLHILDQDHSDRKGIVSFYIDGIHYNEVVKQLSDDFGIQVRGGCSCAGTYGHYLLSIDYFKSRQITHAIDKGDFSSKPGWVRVSLHPTMTNQEVAFIVESVASIASSR